MLSEKQKEYVTEVGSTILNQINRNYNMEHWGVNPNNVIYSPYYEGRKLYGSLIFSISTYQYIDSHYIRVIYDQGYDGYKVQLLRSENLIDEEIINEIEHVYSFGLADEIEALVFNNQYNCID